MGERAFPAPLAEDHEDVHWALTTAQSLHAQGDNVEALRWVRKAVAAAVACDRDGRAIELGRVAAELEESFGAATTQRGDGARTGSFEEAADEPTLKSMVKTVPMEELPVDDLDSPTFIDSDRPGSGPRGSAPVDPFGAVDSEPTLAPFTKASAGAQGVPSTVADQRAPSPPEDGTGAVPIDEVPSAAEDDTFTMPAMNIDDPRREQAEATGGSQPAAPPIKSKSSWPPPGDRTMPAVVDGAVARWRVALLAAADGDARVMVLPRGADPPEGAALALVIPASPKDAQTIATLLRRRDRQD